MYCSHIQNLLYEFNWEVIRVYIIIYFDIRVSCGRVVEWYDLRYRCYLQLKKALNVIGEGNEVSHLCQ